MSGPGTGSRRRTTRRRGLPLVAGAVATALALGGCGDGGGGGAAATSAADPALGTVTTAPDGVQEVTIETPDDYVFLPDHITVAPGRVRLTVRSSAEQMVHNFRFTPDAGPERIDAGIPILRPGESDTIEFEVAAPGDHPFDCSFHIQLGQVGTMTVTG